MMCKTKSQETHNTTEDTMKMVCMYCGKKWENNLKLAPGLPSGTVSHGIGDCCIKRANAEVDALIAKQKGNKR